jgi:hypothetical protein
VIALDETNEYAAEVPVYMPLASNPIAGKLGIAWHDAGGGRTDEFQYRVPGGSWQNAIIAKIIEKGFGTYALRLAAGECTTAGVVTVRARQLDLSAQPCVATEYISQLGGDIAVNGDGYVMFYLADEVDPVFGAPLDSYTFSTGDVKVCLPDGSYANADVSNVTNFGNGTYGLLLKATDGVTTLAGKAYVYVQATGAQPLSAVATILGVGSSVPVVPPGPPPIVVSTTLASDTHVLAVDHLAVGLSRLPEQWKFTKAVA